MDARGARQLEAPKGFREKGEAPTTVVGVVRDLRLHGPLGSDMSSFFAPLNPKAEALRVVVRGKGDTIPDRGMVAKTLSESLGNATVYEVESMNERLDRLLAKPRFYATALGILGGFALLLTLVNAFSVAAGLVAERQKELAIRLALGATAATVRRVLAVRVAPALVVGLLAGWWLNNLVQRLLPNLVSNAKPAPSTAIALESLLLLSCCGAALWICSRPVVRGNPAGTLRAE
jgi:predicted lysophospholipase L1 biosynthesis ABC-type transport system permease subunit